MESLSNDLLLAAGDPMAFQFVRRCVFPLVVDETELQVKDCSPFEGFFILGM